MIDARELTEGEIIRNSFTPHLLDEGEEVKNECCPLCNHWVCGFPTYSFRNWNGKRSKVAIWECWNCKTELVQVEIK